MAGLKLPYGVVARPGWLKRMQHTGDADLPHGMHLKTPAMLALAALAVVSVNALAAPGDSAQAIELVDLEGHAVRPLASTARGVVVVFTRTDCPIAARYAPELERLENRARDAAVDFWLAFVDPDESAASIREYLRSYAYHGRALRDPHHALARLSGATTTPEAAAFLLRNGTPTLVYRGRIDDRYVDVAHVRPAPTRRDLAEVIDSLGAHRPLAFRQTHSVGCLIADLDR
jgi:hypothetical protein